MSSQEDLSSIIQGASDDLVFNHVDNVALALFAYDTLLTLPSEVQYIWSKKIKLGSGLYLLTRYSALLQLGPQVYLNFATFPSLQGLHLGVIFYQCSSIASDNWSARPSASKSIHYSKS
ncbi:hypothetical protein K439DRAFT_981130 [Ramaria rubella]|nr:hypothetical protein K439DRAFT_981130 [Ramaria rubella]